MATQNIFTARVEPLYRDPPSIQLNSPSTTPGYPNDPTSTGTSANFTVSFISGGNQSLLYPPGTEVALEKFWFVNSVFNISPSLNNNYIGYAISGGASTIFEIPAGNYGVAEINNFLQTAITENGDIGSNISLVVDLIQIKTYLTLADGYELDLTQGTLWQQLGATSAAIYSSSGYFPNYVNMFPTTALNVSIPNLIPSYSSMINGSPTATIYTAPIAVDPGFEQTETPPRLKWFPLSNLNIKNINVQIMDQNNKQSDLNGQPCNIVLVFRCRK